ncbi:MAG: hypothetical protein RL533_921 [Pseudomonadota bacterium]
MMTNQERIALFQTSLQKQLQPLALLIICMPGMPGPQAVQATFGSRLLRRYLLVLTPLRAIDSYTAP